jgi:hypothetical protein
MMDKAVLVDKRVVEVPSETMDQLRDWALNFERANRTVARTYLNRRKHIFVSTVFLGIDHGFPWHNTKLWFETMVFGTSINEAMERYETYDEAVRGHARMVRRARQARQIRRRDPRLKKALRGLRRLGRRRR